LGELLKDFFPGVPMINLLDESSGLWSKGHFALLVQQEDVLASRLEPDKLLTDLFYKLGNL